jgi:hypothetical protein
MSIPLPPTIEQNVQQFAGRSWLLPELLDWFENSDERIYCLTGDPGTGKSMIAAWLVGAGPPPGDTASRDQLERLRDRVKAAHFCVAASGSTDPVDLARNVAEQLAGSVPGMGQALTATLADMVTISVSQQVGTMQGGTVTGVRIQHLSLAGLSEEHSFNRALRQPLKWLYDNGYGDKIILLIDGLDEALTYTGATNIVRLLAKTTDLPPQVRFLVTTRPDPRVSYALPEARFFDLVRDAPSSMDDVRLYVRERLAAQDRELDSGQREALAERISQAAEGVFMYAHLVLADLVRGALEIGELETASLPKGLPELYRESLTRELGADRRAWRSLYRPVLGLIAVARGEGLTTRQLERLTGLDVEGVLEDGKQYLSGELPDGPFRPFHRSLAEYLLGARDNEAYRVDGSRMHGLIADHYLEMSGGQRPWRGWDPYGLRYTPAHLAGAAALSTGPDKHARARALVDLLTDEDYRATYLDQLQDDWNGIQEGLRQALACAVDDGPPGSVPLVVRAAQSNLDFETEFLAPQPVFELARRGDVAAAERRLQLFDLERDWRDAALLTIAWLANPAQRDGSEGQAAWQQVCALRDRVAAGLAEEGAFRTLLERLDAALGRAQMPELAPLVDPPAREDARTLVANLGAQDEEGLVLSEGVERIDIADSERVLYFAERDAPLLVSFAYHEPDFGTRLFDEYLALQGSNSYVQYRLETLRRVLEAMMAHPSQVWVSDRLPVLVSAVLSPVPSHFDQGVPLALLAMRAAAGIGNARTELAEWRERILEQAGRLRDKRGRGDVRGHHRRRLATLAECAARLPIPMDDGPAAARELLKFALDLPRGYAGYQSPASLTLAEAARVASAQETPGSAYEVMLDSALEDAHRTAHNIQDFTFCARTTARYNAMRLRWWRADGFDAADAVQRLVRDPEAPDFAALHILGQDYRYRNPLSDKAEMPYHVRDARTLQDLADLYRQPLADFYRVNGGDVPQLVTDEEGQTVEAFNVPDPEFPASLAARFAAEALADDRLEARRRVKLIQSLVPLALANPTALDTVLVRLLLAAYPLLDRAMLEELGQLAPMPEQ